MQRTLTIALIVLLTGAAGPPAGGPDPADDAAFRRVLADPVEQAHVIERARESPVLQNNPCPSAKLGTTGDVAVLVVPGFDASGAIVSGVWRQSVRAEGCGADRLLNVLVAVRGPGTLGTGVLLPGSTRADPKLQRDGTESALREAAKADPTCKTPYVANTGFERTDGPPAAGAPAAPWREVWIVAQCKKRLLVPVRFAPDATTVAVAAGPATPAP